LKTALHNTGPTKLQNVITTKIKLKIHIFSTINMVHLLHHYTDSLNWWFNTQHNFKVRKKFCIQDSLHSWWEATARLWMLHFSL